ncbi:glucose 1-dehydrogenase [Microbacterium pseudoresistens]|uniref:3-oxoacyl-[acyl-carrier protein] reductase n=1 Tax=Microbacterium pseudoresistens TaxID=640634 RepID=A0A7Y9EU42_9MICO|nr:SDR family oxidoreductase [Microbacterium pseudoresistens]NYD53985.1 3-oxoacyl-[acyl-carrier protein] reductase [Microbacterium pseudoresistens]
MTTPQAFAPGLAGRRVLVIGSGPGIGLETARTFAALGARIGVVDIDPGRADDAVAALDGEGHAGFECDVRDAAGVQELMAAVVGSFGLPDVLVNVVGIGGPARGVGETDVELWDEIIGLNLRQQFLVAQAFLPAMMERGSGSVVVISSINAQQSSPLRIPYGVAKAGLDSLVRSLAIEAAPHGVRVNSVRPGSTRTPRRLHLAEGELGELYRREIPIGRLAEPVDVANLVVFLASDLSRHITGEHVVIDGGSTIRYSQPAGN